MTTATFDHKTQEFIIHTPSIEACKFYPGGMGKTATHGVFYCRLLSNGTDYGMQAFLLQIRDMETHSPLQGIEVGDIGAKMALIHSDNGYLKFD